MNNEEKSSATDELVQAVLTAEGLLQNIHNRTSSQLERKALDGILEAIQNYKKVKILNKK